MTDSLSDTWLQCIHQFMLYLFITYLMSKYYMFYIQLKYVKYMRRRYEILKKQTWFGTVPRRGWVPMVLGQIWYSTTSRYGTQPRFGTCTEPRLGTVLNHVWVHVPRRGWVPYRDVVRYMYRNVVEYRTETWLSTVQKRVCPPTVTQLPAARPASEVAGSGRK